MTKKGKQMAFNIDERKLDKDLSVIKDKLTNIIIDLFSSRNIKEREFSDILINGKQLHSDDIDPPSKPEEYTKDHLIRPILTEVLGYSGLVLEYVIKKEFPSINSRKKNKRKFPDYMSNTDGGILIEAEPFGKDLWKNEDTGVDQVYKWLESIQTRQETGIATNGIQWVLLHRDSKDNKIYEINSIDLKDLFLNLMNKVYRRAPLLSYDEKDLDKLIKDFYLTFSSSTITETIGYYSDAIREKKEEITDRFYRELLKYVFGQIEKNGELVPLYDSDYLIADIISNTANENDKNKFAIVFLNRLIFIKFLENKGLINPKNFLSERWKEYNNMSVKGASFYRLKLSPLFYGLFNTPLRERANRNSQEDQIPYLNGGLFRETVEREKEYEIRNEGVYRIIELIDRYSFDLKKDGTYSGENINADILGNIYEKTVNIITGGFKKSEGAYYTPDEITIFISRQALFDYLLKRFKDKLAELGWKENELERYKSISDLISKKITKDNGTWSELIKIIDDTKILDPSCGSGHFLVTALEIIVNLKKEIYKIMGIKRSDFDIKKEVILNNLYGVDIDPMAVEIAKLRLWLSLIESMDISNINHKDILPNIEYNVIQGDSLIGISSINEIKGSLEYESKLMEEIKLYENTLEEYKKATPDNSADLRRKVTDILQQINDDLTPFYTKNPEYQKSNNLNVHWPIVFSQVFSRDNPGFDVIIGNPPYGDLLDNTKKSILGIVYPKLKKGPLSEIASIFSYRFMDLLRNGGNLSFIITFSMVFSKELSIVRDHLKKNFKEIYVSIFDRDRCRIFSSMSQSVSIMFYNEKGHFDGNFYTSRFYRAMPELTGIEYKKVNGFLLSDNGFTDDFSVSHRLPKLGEDINVQILQKIKDMPATLEGLINLNVKKVKIYLRVSGNYWYNAWDFKPYKSTQIKELIVPEKYRGFIITLINSNLMYFFLRVYGDGRHLNTDILNNFRVPKTDLIDGKLRDFDQMAKKLMDDLRSVYDSKNRRFKTSMVKKTIDQCDGILNGVYGFTDEEYEYLVRYDNEVRGE